MPTKPKYVTLAAMHTQSSIGHVQMRRGPERSLSSWMIQVLGGEKARSQSIHQAAPSLATIVSIGEEGEEEEEGDDADDA